MADSVSELINKNSTKTLSQADYNKAYNELTEMYEKKMHSKDKLLEKKKDIQYRITEIKAYIYIRMG